MLLKFVAVAGWAIAVSVSALHAQTGSITRPAEIPPASFKGSQYVDSRGCVFLRAGVGGRTNWVARISRNRKPLCGLPPSSGGARVATVPEVAPERAARATGRPLDTVASVTTAPTIRQRQARSAIPESQYTAPKLAKDRVVRGAPQPREATQRVAIQRDTTPLVRTKVEPYGSVVSAPQRPARTASSQRQTPPLYRGNGYTVRNPGNVYGNAPLQRGTEYQVADPTVIPKGYKLAWKDGRLNPNRGVGTAQGQAAQDLIWTRDVPAKAVKQVVVRNGQKRVVVSSSNAPRGGFYVQVGSFGERANAQGAKGRLSRLGLPAASQRVKRGGRVLDVVLAGPFGDAGQAQSALRAARGAGFGDAFIR